MKNKKMYVCIGSALFVIYFILSVISTPPFARIEDFDIINQNKLLAQFTGIVIILLLSEFFFIKSGIVPKIIKYIIYFHWFGAILVLSMTWIRQVIVAM